MVPLMFSSSLLLPSLNTEIGNAAWKWDGPFSRTLCQKHTKILQFECQSAILLQYINHIFFCRPNVTILEINKFLNQTPIQLQIGWMAYDMMFAIVKLSLSRRQEVINDKENAVNNNELSQPHQKYVFHLPQQEFWSIEHRKQPFWCAVRFKLFFHANVFRICAKSKTREMLENDFFLPLDWIRACEKCQVGWLSLSL